jgi:ABC-type nitrate/sulfonate/bicarbonate transport system substrate-binding protein
MAAISVDALARWMPILRDAAPRVELLMGRSQGQEALAAVGATKLTGLKGKRVAADLQSPAYYFALWCLSRAGLTALDVKWVDLPSASEAGTALREGRADAAAGLYGDVQLAAQARAGTMLATSADAPHLVAIVLVTRGDFAARYPDAVRRVLRGLLDASAAVLKDPGPAARLLGDVAPSLGDPTDAIQMAPPANLKDNLAFFGLSGEAPVTYEELFRSSAELFHKMGRLSFVTAAEDTLDLGALKYVSETRRP